MCWSKSSVSIAGTITQSFGAPGGQRKVAPGPKFNDGHGPARPEPRLRRRARAFRNLEVALALARAGQQYELCFITQSLSSCSSCTNHNTGRGGGGGEKHGVFWRGVPTIGFLRVFSFFRALAFLWVLGFCIEQYHFLIGIDKKAYPARAFKLCGQGIFT